MNIAIIGAGYWGSKHVRVYRELLKEGFLSNLFIYDSNQNVTDYYKNDEHTIIVKDINDIFNNNEITMVDIVTPTPYHYPLAIQALEHNKNVFIEKPVSFKYDEAIKLFTIAKEKNLNLMSGHIFRFHEALLELKRLIKENYFGEIIHIETVRSAFSVPRPDMGVLYALGIHDVDIACMLMDETLPKNILCWGTSYYRSYEDEISTIFLNFENKTTFSATESWLSPASSKRREIIITGSKASAKIDYLTPDTIQIFDSYINKNSPTNSLQVLNDGERIIRVNYKEPLKEELLNFIRSSNKEAKNNSDGLIGARAVYLIEKAVESLKEHKTIAIEDQEIFKSISP